MANLYVLTDQNMRTDPGRPLNAPWALGETHTAEGWGELWGHGWLQAYTDPLLAVLLNPIYFPQEISRS